jgi:serine/threonine protein kinase
VKQIQQARASETPAPADAKYKMTGGTGSLKYMAPEVYLGRNATESVDTYSFAIIMWELLAKTMLLFMRSKKVGHARMEYTPKLWATDAATAGTRPEQPEAWHPVLRDVMAACWDGDASKRPNLKVVIDKLAPLLQPALFTDPSKPAADAAGGCCALQ